MLNVKKSQNILHKALEECRKKLDEMPQFQPLLSIESQLLYLLGLVNKSNADMSRLDEIIVGVYAAKEFEDRDMDFANILYEVEEIVDLLKERQ